MSEPRYEIKNTGFGPNFYDAENDRDLTLADVLALLNRLASWISWARRLAGFVGTDLGDEHLRQAIEDLVGPDPHHAPEGQREYHNRRPGPFVSRKYHHDVVDGQRKEIDRLDASLTSARNALTAAGVEDWEPYPDNKPACGRQRSVAERIAILARRSHEDPARTAYVAGLERAAQSVLSTINDGLKRAASTEFALALEQLCQATRDRAKPTGIVTKAHHDGAMATLRDELRKAHDETGRLTEHNEILKTANRHMIDKLARIVELCVTGPTTRSSRLEEIRDVAKEQLSPSDPAMVEMERANMLAEVDDVLQKAGCWRGGRQDSILELVTRHQGMRACLKLVSEWMERDGPAIRSWVGED